MGVDLIWEKWCEGLNSVPIYYINTIHVYMYIEEKCGKKC